MKIRTVGSKFLHVERQTDRHGEVKGTYLKFAKDLKNCKKI